MKELNEIRQSLREQKPYLAEKYGIEIVGMFGSYVRQEQRLDEEGLPPWPTRMEIIFNW